MRNQTTLLLAMVVLWMSTAAEAKYCGGDGSAEYPYRICTAEDMNEIGANPADWNKHFILVNDVNLAQYTGTQFKIIGPNGSQPFTGVFDGNDHTISNFTYAVNNAGYIGLFGYVGTGGQIKNLGMENVNVNAGTGDFVGGLVGFNAGDINDCYSTGSVSGDDYVGGLVGANSGDINDCYSTGSVSGDVEVGGLVGLNNEGYNITNCYSDASVLINRETSSISCVGGLVGTNRGGSIENCHSTGSVNVRAAASSYIGGLVGYNHKSGVYGRAAVITNCYATGSVSRGEIYVGGLVGCNENDTYPDTITNCYSTGSVSGEDGVGGLVGANSGTITTCYSTGSVSGRNSVGGLGGYGGGYIKSSYSTGSVSGDDEVGGLAGYGGAITCCYFTGSVSGDNYVGGLVGYGGGNIVNSYSTGDVNGAGNCVGGLVGGTDSDTNDCYSTGRVSGDNYVGGLAGLVGEGYLAPIKNCYSDASVLGSGYVGGLVGKLVPNYVYPYLNSTITKSYSAGSVTGDSNVGGLVGDGDGNYVYYSFWDVNTSGQGEPNSDGGTGLSTTLMQTKITFTSVGWDFSDVWTIVNGVDYPKLLMVECRWCLIGGNADGNTPRSEYAAWVAWGKPNCWCYCRQCRGDADGKKTGLYWVALSDLTAFVAAYDKTDAVLKTVPNGICSDSDHKKTGLYRVALSDLTIFSTYYDKLPAFVPICNLPPVYTGPYNFWCGPTGCPITCP